MPAFNKIAAVAACVTLPLISACEPKRVVEALPTPPERLVCEAAGTRPAVPPEYVVDWSKADTVAEARAEHEKFVATLRTREGIVAGYILRIEGRLFQCYSNMRWIREYEAGLSE